MILTNFTRAQLVPRADKLETAEEVDANVSGENGGARDGGDPGDGGDGSGASYSGDPGDGSGARGDDGGDVSDKPEPLSEVQLNKVSVALDFFGMELVQTDLVCTLSIHTDTCLRK